MKASGAVLHLFLVLAAGHAAADVVHTRDGRSVRGTIVAAPAGGGAAAGELAALAVETLQGTVVIPGEEILTVEDHATLAKAIASLKKDLPARDRAADLARISSWAVDKGMFEEALDLADQALLEAARENGSAERLKLHDELLALPLGAGKTAGESDADAAWRLLTASRRPAPARALVAEARLKELARAADVDAALRRGLEDPSPRVRALALRVLAAARPEGTLEAIVDRMLFDRDPSVRVAAARAAEAYADSGVIYPLVHALGQDAPELRLAAMDAIELMHDARAAGALIRHLRRSSGGKFRNHAAFVTQTSYVSDFDVEIAQAAVIAQPLVGVVQHGVVHDVGVAGVFERRVSAAERARVAALLERLTGQQHGLDVAAWERWLAAQPAR